MSYETIKVSMEGPVCFLQLYRPDADNALNDKMVEECHRILALCEKSAAVVVLEGLRGTFCSGADFREIHKNMTNGQQIENNAESLYNLWLKLATGPYITVSHVRGKVNAGGVGFVAASDIVLADQTARFSLSELLFGLFPACVLPFLIRRVGVQRANYMTLTTQPVSAQQALAWGLVDACDAVSEPLLRKHLTRLKCLSKTGIIKYKNHMKEYNASLFQCKTSAVAANLEVFSDPGNLEGIYRYIEKGKLPWEH
ncbi:MAG: enoyl-CoA hydratase/isomerase [Clostridia bacterium]|nr:enoyl-CoA hydratase/isomerase [Clostridia bacterium]